MAGFGDLTWELCRRSDQLVLATLADRRPGARVEIGRMVPRTAQVELAASDPASELVSEGDTLLRCKVAGWTDPLFVGRVTQKALSYDGETESVVANAIDPFVQLNRAIQLLNGLFPAGIRSWRSFTQDQVATIRDLINSVASNGHGIVMQAGLPIGPSGGATFFSGDRAAGSIHWTNPSNAGAEDGSEAVADGIVAALHLETHYLKVTNFGFNIPANATITGIRMRVKCRTLNNGGNTSGNMVTNDVSTRLVKAGAYAGADKANGAEWGTSLGYREYGGDGDLWSTTWTPAQVNASNFGAAIAAQSNIATGFGIANDYYIDHIQVIVYWTAPTGERYFTPALRSLSFPAGSSIGDNVLSIFGMDGAPEFELTPKQASNGDLATMNIHVPRQGSDKSATMILKIGVGDPDSAEDNLTGLSYTPAIDALVNQYLAIGDANGTLSAFGLDWPTHPAVQAKHQGSIDQYGVWETSEALSGLTDMTKLTDSAKAMVGANAFPLLAFSVDLDPDTAPEFSPTGDIWMGDVIALHAELPEETLDLEGRIAGATITEDEDGDCEVTLACEPDHSLAGVTTTQMSVVVDASDGQVPPPPEPPDDGGGGDGGGGGKKKKRKKKRKKK